MVAISKIYPGLTPKKAKPIKRFRGTITQATQKPLSEKTRSDILKTLVGGDWVQYSDICNATGLVRGTIGRAARLLTAEGLTEIRLIQVGRGLPGNLRLL